MNDRARAIALLKHARDLLASRLTDRLLDEAEAILDDARGESYHAEIEALYEQLGGRLSHVNQMLQHLPPVAEETAEPATGPASPVPLGLPAPRALLPVSMTEEPATAALSPAADTPSATLVHDVASPPITFQTFAQQAQAGDVAAAAQTLSLLCELDAERALRCAAVFVERLASEPQFLAQAQALRGELARDSVNGALMLLYQCFGLVGMEAMSVLQTLRLRLRNEP